MSLSRRLRVSVIASIAVLITGIGVAVAVPASTPASRTIRTQTQAAAAATFNGYASRVIGSFGSGGTVRGFFVPERSLVHGKQTFVQGNLTATLRRANGALVTGVTRHDVALPVNASGARQSAQAALAPAATSCTILHLVLGPLNLNLLGLVVHLNRVVLDITAQSGPGNLLGNLLCAVAHLLDGTNPTTLDLLRLSNLLNRVIGILT
jgi:hypothetical protein